MDGSSSPGDICRRLAPAVRLLFERRDYYGRVGYKGEDEFGRTWQVLGCYFGSRPGTQRTRIIIEPVPKNSEAVARELCALLEERVYFGDVKNLYEEDFSFSEDFQVDYQAA